MMISGHSARCNSQSIADEGSALLSYRRRDSVFIVSTGHCLLITGFILLALVGLAVSLLTHGLFQAFSRDLDGRIVQSTVSFPLWGKKHKKDKKLAGRPPAPQKRCEWVQQRFQERDAGTPQEELRERYAIQSTDSNVFYRATAHIFWRDFRDGGWGNLTLSTLHDVSLRDGVPLDPKSTWTWVTGDQHLSNFGAWRNRHGDVVFGVNDFDEAAIYDFHVDVLRIAVSICNHAITNGFSDKEVKKALHVFTDSYIDTVIGYVGNEDALLFELTPDTSHGKLQKFLKDVEETKSASKQLQKFTDVSPATGSRHFIKGPIDVPHNDTDLAAVPPKVEQKIRDAFSPTGYGATMMKLGWHVREWDDNFFSVLDVTERVGSGVGSFGVDRFYVLLKGTDGLLDEGKDGAAVILDVKMEPIASVHRVLSSNDAAWYNVLFANEAARVVEAQRRLTSYVDPFTGWIMLDDEQGISQPFYVRQRSPWKDDFDIDDLEDPKDFYEFAAQIATSTATSHVRGTVAKAPGDFKNVIAAIMHKKSNRKLWSKAVSRLARAYHEQVLLDFQCFREFVHASYGVSR